MMRFGDDFYFLNFSPLSNTHLCVGNEFDINVGLKKKKRRKRDNFIADKWEEVGFYLRTLPKIFEKVQSRDPAFLNSLKDEQLQVHPRLDLVNLNLVKYLI